MRVFVSAFVVLGVLLWPNVRSSDARAVSSFGCATCANTTFVSDTPGTYSVTLTATNAVTGRSASSTVLVTVNPAPPPVGDISSPVFTAFTVTANGKSKNVTVSASVSDNVGVSRVEFVENGVLKASVSVPPFVAVWKSAAGRIVSARAYDAAGNVGLSSLVAVK